jgi:hypothetical protein
MRAPLRPLTKPCARSHDGSLEMTLPRPHAPLWAGAGALLWRRRGLIMTDGARVLARHAASFPKGRAAHSSIACRPAAVIRSRTATTGSAPAFMISRSAVASPARTRSVIMSPVKP